jgi:pimeloyl-ACP methyl ester carboxylesterase
VRTIRWGATCLGGLLALAAAVPAAAADGGRQRVELTLSGGEPARVAMCGGEVAARSASEGARVTAAVRITDPAGLRWGGRRTRLTIERCEDGRWVRVSARGFGTSAPYRRVRTARVAVPTEDPADLRVRASVEGDRHRRAAASRPAYLRVGVGEIVDLPVEFAVKNVNRSRVACPSDGADYPLRGHLVMPATRPQSVTLYVHGVEIDSEYLRYRAVPGYDFQREMAERGHASVAIDRLGHGRSGLPPAGATCLGAQADVADQTISALRSGGYRSGHRAGPSFARVALAGHSLGGFIAEVSAFSFPRSADVLVVLAFAAEGINGSLLVDRVARGEAPSCGAGGREKTPGGPGGYAYVWPDPDVWTSDTVYNAETAVVERAREMRERSPCGDLQSTIPGAAVEPANYREITVPVLLVFARQDAVFPPPAGERHRDQFTGSNDVTLIEIDDAGHSLMLQRTAPEFRRRLSDWLRARGF